MARTLWWCFFILVCATFTWAQRETSAAAFGPMANGDLPREEIIRKDVQEVNLFFTARDWRGKIRTDLKLEDINLVDNGRPPEKITRFEAQTEVPLRVVLLVDTSDSITEKLRAEKAAALVFLEQVVRPGMDEVMVVTFGGKVQVVQGFTGNLPKLRKSVEAVEAKGSTAFYDAIAFAAGELNRSGGSGGRQVIIVISDGQENASQASEKTAMAEALKSNAVIFALSTKGEFAVNASTTNNTDVIGFMSLRKFARATGGQVVGAQNRKQLSAAFTQLQQELRGQYFVAYKPSDFAADGSYRRIKLRGAGLHFNARKGYYAFSGR